MRLYGTMCKYCGTGIVSLLMDQRDAAADQHTLETALLVAKSASPFGPFAKQSTHSVHKVYKFDVELDLPTELGIITTEGL